MATRELGLVIVVLLLAAAYFYQDPEWNGNSRLDLTKAVVEQGTFQIDSYHASGTWATGDKAFYNGHYYSDKAIGSSLLAVPLYFLLYRMGAMLGMTFSSILVKHVLTTGVMGAAFTLSGLATYLVARKITGNPWKALVPTLAISFGTMMWPYSVVFYGHVLGAAFLILAFYLLFSTEEQTHPISNGRFLWIGLAVGMAFIAEYTSAPVMIGLAAYALYVLRRIGFPALARAALWAALGALIPLLAMFAYNMVVYGSVLAFGYTHEAEDKFQQVMSLGIAGIRLPTASASYHITFDPQFGLFWLSPVLLLAPIGYLLAFKTSTHRAEALLSLFAVAALFVVNAGSFMWWGGSSFGPRLIIPALPFFVVPLAMLPDALAWPLGALSLISSANMLIPLMGQIQFTKLDFKLTRDIFYVADAPFRGFSLLYDYGVPQIWRQYEAGTPSWTLGAAVGLPYWLSVPALVAIESALIFWFRRGADSEPSDHDRGTGKRKPIAPTAFSSQHELPTSNSEATT